MRVNHRIAQKQRLGDVPFAISFQRSLPRYRHSGTGVWVTPVHIWGADAPVGASSGEGTGHTPTYRKDLLRSRLLASRTSQIVSDISTGFPKVTMPSQPNHATRAIGLNSDRLAELCCETRVRVACGATRQIGSDTYCCIL